MSQLFRKVLLVALLLIVACKKHETATADVSPLPVITAESADFLFTWIDERGEFHVDPKVAAIPVSSRETVRVADPIKDPPKLDDVFVADLRTAGPDGRFPVKTMARTEFEKIALDRRKTGGQKPLEARPAASVLPGDEAPSVIIYGASWCGPCHQAADYLKEKNIRYVLKDIEKDSGADLEMRGKLDAAGKRGGSIPVIDVKGTILIGFDQRQLDRALKM